MSSTGMVESLVSTWVAARMHKVHAGQEGARFNLKFGDESDLRLGDRERRNIVKDECMQFFERSKARDDFWVLRDSFARAKRTKVELSVLKSGRM